MLRGQRLFPIIRTMPTDATTRLLLAGILVCLVILVAQGFGSGPGSDSRLGGWGRYQVMGMRAGTPVLIRTDTVTGQAWKLELRGGRDRWVKLTDRDGESGSDVDVAEPEPAAEAPGAPVAPDLRVPAPIARSSPAPADGPDFAMLADAVRRSQLPHDIRIWAVGRLGDLDDPRATDVLLEALEDADARVVAAAVAALGAREDERVSAALEATRANPDPAVQEALDALGSTE